MALRKPRKLLKKTLKPLSFLMISACGDWLAANHWAVRLDTIEEGGLIDTQKALQAKFGDVARPRNWKGKGGAPDALRYLPTTNEATSIKYTDTLWVYDGNNRALKGDNGDLTTIQDVYASFLLDDCLYGPPAGKRTSEGETRVWGPLYDAQERDEITAILMPAFNPEEDLTDIMAAHEEME